MGGHRIITKTEFGCQNTEILITINVREEGKTMTMLLWLIISILVVAAAIGAMVYLVIRVYQFPFIEKISDKKMIKTGMSLLMVLVLVACLWIAMGYINAIICVIHLVVFWLFCDFIAWLLRRIFKKQTRRGVVGIFAVLITIMYLTIGWYLDYHVWETDYTVQTEKQTGNIRIVQMADSHIGATFDGEGFARYVVEMQKQNPDVVLITGDFVDDGTSKADMETACKALGTMKTKYGIYYVFGNHDKGYYGKEHRGYDGDDLKAELEKNGVNVLEDESVLIDNRFYIIGRQDLSEETEHKKKRATMTELTEKLDKDKFMVVMDHQPCDYTKQEEADVDLVLSGHTHGGQLIPINYVGEWIGQNDKTYGYEKRKNTSFVVTSGISDWEIKFKTGCKSEYVVINVEGK